MNPREKSEIQPLVQRAPASTYNALESLASGPPHHAHCQPPNLLCTCVPRTAEPKMWSLLGAPGLAVGLPQPGCDPSHPRLHYLRGAIEGSRTPHRWLCSSRAILLKVGESSSPNIRRRSSLILFHDPWIWRWWGAGRQVPTQL